MAENFKGQGKKPWIPPNLAAVPYGPVPKTQSTPIDQMPPRDLSNQQLQPRFGMKPRPIEEMQPRSSIPSQQIQPPYIMKPRPMEEMQPQSSRPNSPFRRRTIMEPKSMEDMRPQSRRSRSPRPPRRTDKNPRPIEEMQPQTKRSISSLLGRNLMEPRSIEEMQPQTKRSISSLLGQNSMEPRSIDKVQFTPRSIKEMQPQTRRTISSLRPLIVMKSKSIDNTPTPGEIPNVPKVSLMSLKACPATSTGNDSTKQKSGRQTFYMFSDLPLELQIMIWQWYGRVHADSNPNVIKILRCFRPVLQNFTVRENPSERDSYFAISYKLPPIFYVCKLTFKIAKDLYEKEFQVIPMIKDDKQLTYFNEDRDIIVLEDAHVLRDWRYNRQTEAEFAGWTQTSLSRPAAERITRRINMKHLVIGGTSLSHIEARQLARFYDCESIMLGVPYLIRSRFFSTEDRSQPDREAISFLRDRLLRFWKEERRGPFVREDYRRKPTRPVVVEPSWDTTERTISNPMFFICTGDEISYQLHRLHPAITNFMRPVPEAKSSITFMNGMKFSHKHSRLFEYPWECVPKKNS
ncbi:uncharacterized protein Bfra_010934 [Botrytis fragariae]|uniref:2EXR domain-containing protein n=1 Tax=Botrytis fragariae TaxID=1964551 RepID=A0A8H6ALT9_9HELO|nr:uncharacterized protein Bfra_010934 [Botrytis fragariae]KAF5869734.1 hypothetical protein Bfra_010934 [Botrytis fragariae]